MRKKLAAAAVGAALLVGGGAGAALMQPVIATAADETPSSGSSTTAPDAKRGEWVSTALKKLVDAGTITQKQADAVEKALAAARPEGGPRGEHFGGPGLAAVATALGIQESELQTALQSGKTIAEVAQAKNVDVQKVIDAIVAEMNSHLDEAVSSGRLTQAQADELKANATERATALVNGELPARGPGGPGGGRFGGPPPGAPQTDGTTSSSSSTSTSI